MPDSHNRSASIPAIEGGTPVRDASLPFCRAAVDESEVEAVADVVRSGWLTLGPRTEALEERMRDYLGVGHTVAVSSCSEAMFLSLLAAGVGPGDEVITSSLTFASTVTAIIHAGATPVLADIETETFGADPAHVSSLITPRTRAVLPVHFGGQACRIEEIVALARERGLAVVEDAAHGFGASVDGRRLGAFGDATAFSFYATKNLTTGEGGAITTDSEETADKVRLLSYHGMSRDSWTRYTDRGSWYYEVVIPGYKSNMNDVQAAIGLSQMDKIDALLERRAQVAERLRERLQSCDAVSLPATRGGNNHTWHLFVIRLNLDRLCIDRDRFIEALSRENIGSSVHFIPVYRHPFFAPYGADSSAFPKSEDYFARCISLPIYPGMSDADADDVAEAVVKIATYYRAD
jgi:dTDP-4-amino-4,6-dideoxygalactose transaminase